jgi:hypothetical protein
MTLHGWTPVRASSRRWPFVPLTGSPKKTDTSYVDVEHSIACQDLPAWPPQTPCCLLSIP